MIRIIPAILTNDIREISDKLTRAQGVVDRVQIDIIDGQFVNNKTIDPSSLENIETEIKIDFHLMTKEPIGWVERCVKGGADRIIGQIEMMSNQVEFVGKVARAGAMVGLAIDINTPISSLDPAIIDDLDIVLVMSVPAGFGGQEFDPRALDKIRELNEIRLKANKSYSICVDGGETLETVDNVKLEGANEIVIGSILWSGDLKNNIDKFIKATYK